MMSFIRTIRFTMLAVIILALASCGVIQVTSGGELKTETHSVDLGAASAVNVKINMNQGIIKVNGDAQKLMEGTFDYNVAEWHPEVSYNVDSNQGTLVIDQPDIGGTTFAKNVKNTWDLHLNNSVPIELDIQVGAGVNDLNLSGLQLTRLNVQTGAGENRVDLSGSWTHDVIGTFEGGIGGLKIMLPRDVGVHIDLTGRASKVKTSGLTKDGNAYINQAYGKSPQILQLSIQSGIGEVDLQVE
jgi:hypothetical protein